MSTAISNAQHPTAWLQVLLGGLIVAAGDITFATTLWFEWSAAGLIQCFQSIAVGVLGKASFEGGMTAAALGAGLHVFMATMFVVACTLVGRRVPELLRRPFVYGPLYGALLYVIMNFVVMPLSRVGAHPTLKHTDWILYSILAHMLFGVVCVVFARRALRNASRSGEDAACAARGVCSPSKPSMPLPTLNRADASKPAMRRAGSPVGTPNTPGQARDVVMHALDHVGHAERRIDREPAEGTQVGDADRGVLQHP